MQISFAGERHHGLLFNAANSSRDLAMQSICVLGMHRSGTSCLTGILQKMGVELGEVHEKNPFNARGNRENPLIMKLNDDVLAQNSGAWDQPQVAATWSAELRDRRQDIIQALSAKGGFWGFKDPRCLFTLPFWEESLELRLVGTFRHPLRVAASLHHRNKMSLDGAFCLWASYNSRLLDLVESRGFPLVNFDLDEKRYLDNVRRAATQLGLDADLMERAKQFFEMSLRAQDSATRQNIELPQFVAHIYRRLQDAHDQQQ